MRRLLLLLALSLAAHAASGETIAGKVAAVADGDTLTIVDKDRKRHRIRLAEIDAPERKQPFGARSRQSLSEICLQKPAVVETVEHDSNRRLVGKVSCAGIDAGTEQVRRGMAWVFVRATLPNSPLPEAEANARLRGLGLWAADKPEPPWEWRKRQGVAAKK
jgi:endonuclease YncB( thermonuclease family)